MSIDAGARRKIVRKLAERHGAGCVYCGAELTPEPSDGRQVSTSRTLDHLTPRSKGGRTNLRNLVLACAGCNGRKGDRLPLEFIASRVGAS